MWMESHLITFLRHCSLDKPEGLRSEVNNESKLHTDSGNKFSHLTVVENDEFN
jgi:hypothetical protein